MTIHCLCNHHLCCCFPTFTITFTITIHCLCILLVQWPHTFTMTLYIACAITTSVACTHCTCCSRGGAGSWSCWNSLSRFPSRFSWFAQKYHSSSKFSNSRGGHPRVLLPAQLVLEEDDRERALHHRREQLPRGQALHPLPGSLPAALWGHYGMQVRQSCFYKELSIICKLHFSAGTTTGTPSTTLRRHSTATYSNRFEGKFILHIDT